MPARWFKRPILANRKLGPVIGIPALRDVHVVAVPGHDTAAAFTAMPAAADGTDLFISSGTWSLVGFESDRPLLLPSTAQARVSNERLGDGRFRPLTNVIGLWLLERTLKDLDARPASQREWVQLLREAARLPVPPALLDVDDPAFIDSASMRAAIDAQLRRRRMPAPRTAAAYTRLICQSLGAGHAAAMRRFQALSSRCFARILMVGGGAKNPLLAQATADASLLPVHAFEIEGSATGNIASQLIALRAVKDLAQFRAAIGAQLRPAIYAPDGSRL